MVQLPGIKDPERAKNLIGKTALLEFKLVDEENSLDEALRGNVPEGSVIAYGAREDKAGGPRGQAPYLLKNKTLLTGASLETAKVQISDRFGDRTFPLNSILQGAAISTASRMETSANAWPRARRRGQLRAVIQERISGGQGRSPGTSPWEEARDLAIVLRAGALPLR